MAIFTGILLLLACLVLGYPVAAFVVHGLEPALWPAQVTSPSQWFGNLVSLEAYKALVAYADILIGRSPAFTSYGPILMALILSPVLLYTAYRWDQNRKGPLRDPSDTFGSARFATGPEMAAMRQGLELGLDPGSGRAVRVAVQGTLATLAPPRKGKTSGLLIPNLAFAEPQSWSGPAVVIDMKGEVFRAVAERRRKLGRRVVCLDPLSLVGGEDRWNPLAHRDPSDVLYLQHTAQALLPEAISGNEASAYFRNRAVDLITAALLVTLRLGTRDVVQVQQLITQDELFTRQLKRLGTEPAALSALELLEADPKTRDPVKSTALQAFQWLADERLRRLVGASTFALSDLSSNEVDLFIVVPPEYKGLLAPLFRWLLSDLFTAVRRNRPAERIVVFLDEAAALGRFEEILTAAGELPGYGASLWTMWQDRAQIVSLYGEAGASIILNTAEIVTVFDVPAVDPDESERWSRALGEYSAFLETTNKPDGKGTSSTSRASTGVRLMTKEALVTMPTSDLLVFANSGAYARQPLRLRKTVSYTDPRFTRLVQNVAPVGATR